MEINKYRSSDIPDHLYSQMFGRREINREMKSCVCVDDCHVWFVAEDEGKVVGFCGRRRTKNGWYLAHDYVIPERRREGIYTKLFKQRMYGISGRITAAALFSSLPVFVANGFKSERGRKNGCEVYIEI